MFKSLPVLAIIAVCVVVSIYFLRKNPSETEHRKIYLGNGKKKKKTQQERAMFTEERIKYEYDMIKDGGTGLIPRGIHERELQQAYRLPVKERDQSMRLSPFADNSYSEAGPHNIGGRTRAVAFDVRFGTAGNSVIIAGAVSGGLFRSADGGANWTRVTPENEIHNVTALAQDPRPGKQNIWYAGGGEPIGNSASPPAGGAFYYGYGLMKSVDNGATWQRIQSTYTGTLEEFDDVYDIVHKIIVNPVNGHVYVCGHRRLMRSTDEGVTFGAVFAGTQLAGADNGQMDIVATNTGTLILAVNGGFPEQSLRGVWLSNTGNQGSWSRFAGGQTLSGDSIVGWRGNSYGSGGTVSEASKRILLALAPSNNNILYTFYENGLSQEGSNGKPEADLFKFDFSNSSFTNLSANMPDFNGQRNGIDPLAVQGGYDMLVAVKPDNPNVVFVGGTNLYRSTNGFTTKTATSWIGGYQYWGPNTTEYDVVQYENNHPDIHNLIFDPTNASRALCATDGGLHLAENILANAGATKPVTWQMIGNYQTTQYYHVNLEVRPSGNQVDNFIGGMQDNSTYLRVAGNNDHVNAGSGDGGAAAISKFNSFSDYMMYVTSQLGSISRLIPNDATNIRPNGLTSNFSGGFGEFVTYFALDHDNTEDMYYVNFNRIFRTTAASSVTPSTWTELTGVANRVNPGNSNGTDIGIRAIELSRGPYMSSHVMYLGSTEGRVFRLNDPRNVAVATAPVDITPPVIEDLITGGTLQNARVNVSDIAVNPNNDDEVMVVYSNYQVTVGTTTHTDINIWWTTNAKSSSPTWTLIEGNLTLPSIRSCVIVARKDPAGNPFTEYYVGTSVGLYSTLGVKDTLNAGRPVTWKREGGSTLNYSLVTSLAYRPQDNRLLVGTHGNGMYFTTIPSPNFTPNINTGTVDPVINNKNFIRYSWPGITRSTIGYQTGNMFEIKRITVQVHNVNGQLVFRKETGYQNGDIDVARLPGGTYVLTITSEDNKQRFITKFIKQ
ncbi:T9SS type A sorting domain-containing protein [Flavihumibacter solisilvae]|uniref:Secretion system C-terminal sorting domain-containing protein n=1 Tax=Flavihumibacter solisilvae TaxID=1349421 RepID=A0A0C1L7K5_9BACT|nr:T9SS type A sorting domain-containing protein [Flavihumibacter solisilvae]KIC96152.1 hypothetical protein OI18_03060 [Flavihumibacter solisilvae]